jgi:hypothetical protein
MMAKFRLLHLTKREIKLLEFIAAANALFAA